jgi:hypothetical protein
MVVLSIGFVIIGIVMLVTGILVALPPMFYVLDFVFCFLISWFFYDLRDK